MDLKELSKDELTFRPVTINEWGDLQLLFAEPGVQDGCWCMYENGYNSPSTRASLAVSGTSALHRVNG